APGATTRKPTVIKWGKEDGRPGSRSSDPVVGWLVAISGPAKGEDFRICNGNNSVGSDGSNRICIEKDPEISGKNHTNIAYARLTNTYHISPSHRDVRGLVYIRPPGPEEQSKWELVENTRQIEPFWVIRIGGSNLLFVPLCSEELFVWDL